jgi:hypothetical protein
MTNRLRQAQAAGSLLHLTQLSRVAQDGSTQFELPAAPVASRSPAAKAAPDAERAAERAEMEAAATPSAAPVQRAVELITDIKAAIHSGPALETAAGLPAGWDAVVSRSTGDTYYKNTVTDETTWEMPAQPAAEAALEAELALKAELEAEAAAEAAEAAAAEAALKAELAALRLEVEGLRARASSMGSRSPPPTPPPAGRASLSPPNSKSPSRTSSAASFMASRSVRRQLRVS